MHHSNELPKSFSNYFTDKQFSSHVYGTRTRKDLHRLYHQSVKKLDKLSVRDKVSKIWNSLPDSLKVIGRTSKHIKNKLKIYLQQFFYIYYRHRWVGGVVVRALDS